jgi:hypothetical protein
MRFLCIIAGQPAISVITLQECGRVAERSTVGLELLLVSEILSPECPGPSRSSPTRRRFCLNGSGAETLLTGT